MIALFFEVTPRAGQDDRYLEIAAALKPELEASGGCRFLDRFRSLSRPRTMLSHQLWADEASLARWRVNQRHHGAQTAGRNAVLEDYRLRVGAVVAEAGPGRTLVEHAPGLAYNDPALTPERWMVVVRSTGAPLAEDGSRPWPAREAWRSVYDAGEHAVAGAVCDRGAGLAMIAEAAMRAAVRTALLVLVSRDYGLRDRREAPQWYPPVTG